MHILVSATETAFASKYLQQLCKHFAHKVPAEWTPEAGTVNFPFGLCEMRAEDGQLKICCTTDDEANLPRLRGVIDVHMVTFAWREKLRLEWQQTTS